MPTKDGFPQAYNAQAGVETASRLIVGARVTQAPNDKPQLIPALATVCELVSPAHVLADSGYVSEAAVTRAERETPGLRVLAALIRESHGRNVAQLEKQDDPPEPAAAGPTAVRVRNARGQPACTLLKIPLRFAAPFAWFRSRKSSGAPQGAKKMTRKA